MPGSPEPIAQTNLQLYAQLRRAGWVTGEIEMIGRTYLLAADLLAGWYRANGKPFVDHFVGTASVAAASGCRPAVVRAALLHNAYGPILRPVRSDRISRRERREVREVAGPDAEELVYAYRWYPWDDAAVHGLLGRVGALDSRERDVVMIRLANEVDDRTDLGMLHARQPQLDTEPMVELAERMGESVLAEALRRVAAEESLAGAVEPGLRSSEVQAVFRTPRWHRRRLAVALRADLRWARRQGRRVAHRLRRG